MRSVFDGFATYPGRRLRLPRIVTGYISHNHISKPASNEPFEGTHRIPIVKDLVVSQSMQCYVTPMPRLNCSRDEI
ncbi:MAG: hypothetical protein AAF434_12405 [Pseudomonadota bacterium]